MKKFALMAAALVAIPSLFFSSTAFANSPGQLQNSDNFYKVKNVTKGGDYAKSVSATCDETVKFSVMVANGEYGALSGVTVKTTLAGATSVSATNTANQTTSTSGSVSVNVTKGSLVYVAGSTVRINEDNSTVNLADGITNGGVNAGNLAGSTAMHVQFQAKVKCDTPPAPKNITVCELATKKVITIREDEFDAKKHSKDLNKCAEVPTPGKVQVCELATKQIVTIDDNKFDTSKYSKDLNDCKVEEVLGTEAPTVIAATGPTGAIAAMFGLSGLAAAAVYFLQRRNILG